jgi:hypothetical protein
MLSNTSKSSHIENINLVLWTKSEMVWEVAHSFQAKA